MKDMIKYLPIALTVLVLGAGMVASRAESQKDISHLQDNFKEMESDIEKLQSNEGQQIRIEERLKYNTETLGDIKKLLEELRSRK